MKRIFDLFFSLIFLILLSPVILFFCLAVKISMGSPILFLQERPGLNGKLFKIIKFRTMKSSKESKVDTTHDIIRTTKLGNFMRSYSIDELPELLNVIKGDMSLVGPRPLLKEYLSQYNSLQIKRHRARPGITGWAQINGRNEISWEKKFEFDNWYIENQSILLDIKIIFFNFYSSNFKKA